MTYWDDLSAALRKKAGENPLVESAIAVLSFLVSTILTVFMVGLAYFILQYIIQGLLHGFNFQTLEKTGRDAISGSLSSIISEKGSDKLSDFIQGVFGNNIATLIAILAIIILVLFVTGKSPLHAYKD